MCLMAQEQFLFTRNGFKFLMHLESKMTQLKSFLKSLARFNAQFIVKKVLNFFLAIKVKNTQGFFSKFLTRTPVRFIWESRLGFHPHWLADCWRALARQLPILYNREKKAKFVGCKIGDLHSKFGFYIRGLLNVETCAVDYGCLWMHVEMPVEISIHFKR